MAYFRNGNILHYNAIEIIWKYMYDDLTSGVQWEYIHVTPIT